MTPSNRSPEYSAIINANSREQFEDWAKTKGYNLSPLTVNGQFHHYMDQSTDDAWLGYCAATVHARTVALPVIRKAQEPRPCPLSQPNCSS